MTPVDTAGSHVRDLLRCTPCIPDGAEAMMQLVTLPPGSPGIGPHRHSGPVFGYVLDGEILFELEGDEPRPIGAGEAFWEPGGDVVHYRAANLRDDVPSRFVVVMLCAPGAPMLTFLDDDEIAARARLRIPAGTVEAGNRSVPRPADVGP